jgi:predicted RNA-binding Zn-ribbon protein involved in translation (DUF1610 family)
MMARVALLAVMEGIHGVNYSLLDEFSETKVSNFFKLAVPMHDTKFIRGECEHCGGHLEFPAHAAGSATDCPHCGQSTALRVSTGETASRISGKKIVFIFLALVILGGGLIAAMIALDRAKRMAGRQPPAAGPAVKAPPAADNPFAHQDFLASPVALEKTPGTSMVRAVGSVKNLAAKRRFSVRVEIELKNAAGQKLESTKDYVASMEPGATWQFKPLVLPKDAASASVIAITEDK